MSFIYWNDGASLYHYGVQGQKWGERRWQNIDGSLTEEGRKHYGYGERRNRTNHIGMVTKTERPHTVTFNKNGQVNKTPRIIRVENGTDTNDKYTPEQRKRDLAVYGRTGVKRIERDIKNGIPISGARSKEATRINNARNTAKTVGKVGKLVGTVGGAVGSRYALSALGASSLTLPGTNALLSSYVSDPIVSGAVKLGAAGLGGTLGKIGGESVTMLLYGYNPNKLR